jgi:hypothetical protein
MTLPRAASSLQEGIELLRQRWPQTHAVYGPRTGHAIFVPSVQLRGYDKDICTVIFIAPFGFPATAPNGFYTDIQVNLPNGMWPCYTRPEYGIEFKSDFQQWTKSQRWFWRLQAWDPNTCGLVTYMNVIRQRLKLAQ